MFASDAIILCAAGDQLDKKEHSRICRSEQLIEGTLDPLFIFFFPF